MKILANLAAILFIGLFFLLKPAMSMETAYWEEDLDFLVETLVSVHPNPFHRTSEETFYNSVEKLRAELSGLEDHEIPIRFMKIVTQLHDGHSGLDPEGEAASFDKWFPLRFEQFEEGIFIISAATEYRDIIGARVLKFGSSDSAEIMKQAMETSNGENPMNRLYYAGYILPQAQALKAFGAIDQADEITLEIEKVGQPDKVIVKSITMPFNLNWFWPGPAAPGGDSINAHDNFGDDLALTYRNQKSLYNLNYLENEKTLFVHFKLFLNGKDFSFLPSPTPTLEEFYEQVFQAFDENDVEKLVIDIRTNGGGNNQLIPSFIQRISQSSEINQRGKLFVITGRKTYSAAMNFVSMMAAQTNAIFVGEAPAGSPSHYGDATGFVLPNSNMFFSVSTLAWSTDVEPWDLRVQFQPDIVVIPQASNYFAGRDDVYDIVQGPGTPVPILDQLKNIYSQDGYDSAMAAFENYRSDNPENFWVDHGYSLLTFGNFVEGAGGDFLQVYKTATDLYPDFDLAWFAYGRALYYERNYVEAEKALKIAADLRPGNNLITRFYAAVQKKPKASE